VTWAVVFAIGFLVGFVIARWWTLVFALAFAVYIASVTEVDEVPHAWLGFLYGLFAAMGVSAGVLIRRRRPSRRGS
jgi:MYXO-CTERM domain-containing protein